MQEQPRKMTVLKKCERRDVVIGLLNYNDRAAFSTFSTARCAWKISLQFVSPFSCQARYRKLSEVGAVDREQESSPRFNEKNKRKQNVIVYLNKC